MKFTILSHAGLLVEHKGVTVLIDPWLRGSCYWRSWWNFPAPDPRTFEHLKPDYIYITHFHWDHFQSPSLRLFPRSTPILVARFPSDRMVRDLEFIGFNNVTEIPSGAKTELGNGLALHSFQFGIIPDSAIVLTDGNTVIFDVNDCKMVGLALRQVVSRFSKIDFVLRSHSSAQAIPYCIEDYERDFSDLRQPADYAEEFTNFGLHVGAGFAIPFASNHCFLHRETKKFNATLESPEQVAKIYNEKARHLNIDSECVLMPPGSSWSDKKGFEICPFDYASKDEYIAKLSEKHHLVLKDFYEEEANEPLDEGALHSFFEGFFASLPRFLSWWKPLQVKLFVLGNGRTTQWLLDFRKRKIETADDNTRSDIDLRIGAKVLNDCTRLNMFASLAPSKRLSIALHDKTRVVDIWFLIYVLEQYEFELLPLWKNFRLRSLGARLRRWREIVEVVRLLLRHKVLGRPFRIADMYPVAPGTTKRMS